MTLKDNLPLSMSDKILAECIGQEPPPCQAACPLDIRVREKLRYLQEDKPDAALAVVLERCPFPGILGRICTHPCEQACTRNSLDQPIAIAGLKRYLAEYSEGQYERFIDYLPNFSKHLRVAKGMASI